MKLSIAFIFVIALGSYSCVPESTGSKNRRIKSGTTSGEVAAQPGNGGGFVANPVPPTNPVINNPPTPVVNNNPTGNTGSNPPPPASNSAPPATAPTSSAPSDCDASSYDSNGCVKISVLSNSDSNHNFYYPDVSTNAYSENRYEKPDGSINDFGTVNLVHNTKTVPDFSTIEDDKQVDCDTDNSSCQPDPNNKWSSMAVNFYPVDKAFVGVGVQEGDEINLAELPPSSPFTPDFAAPYQIQFINFTASPNGCDFYSYMLPTKLSEFEGVIKVVKYNRSGNDNDYDFVVEMRGVKLVESQAGVATGKVIYVDMDFMGDIYKVGDVTCK